MFARVIFSIYNIFYDLFSIDEPFKILNPVFNSKWNTIFSQNTLNHRDSNALCFCWDTTKFTVFIALQFLFASSILPSTMHNTQKGNFHSIAFTIFLLIMLTSALVFFVLKSPWTLVLEWIIKMSGFFLETPGLTWSSKSTLVAPRLVLVLKSIPDISWPLKAHSQVLDSFLATESPLKLMKNAFYMSSKVLFFLKIFTFLSWLFGHVAKGLDKKD